MTLSELESELRALLKGEFSSLHLTFNDEMAINYMTVDKWCAEVGEEMQPEWISPEEEALARKNNACWTLHWYPDTPVGFCCCSASSLPALIGHIREAA